MCRGSLAFCGEMWYNGGKWIRLGALTEGEGVHMSIFKNRPLLIGAGVWMVSALLGFLMAVEFKLWLLSVCLVLLGIGLPWCVIYRIKRGGWHGVMVLFCLFCMAVSLFSSYMAFDRPSQQVSDFVGEACVVRGRVTQRRSFDANFATYVLDIEAIDGESVSVSAYLTCYYGADLDMGDVVEMEADVLWAYEALGDIYESYQLLSEGMFLAMVSEDATTLAVMPSWEDISWYAKLTSDIARHRTTTAAKLKIALGKDTAGLVSALFLGERSYLAACTVRDFSRSGVSHMLAISGLHMTILFGTLMLLFKLCLVPPKMRAMLLGLISVAYLGYLGFPPSATRAVVMLGMTYLSTLTGRRADALTSLGLAGVLILIFDPWAVADVGFWLSFSSTFGLVTLLPWIRGGGRGVKRQFLRVGKGLLAGTVAISTSLWLVSLVFGEVSVYSAPMTLLLTPLMGVLLFLTPLYLLLSGFGLQTGLGCVISWLVDVALDICAYVSRLPFGVLSVGETWIFGVAVGMLVGLLVLLAVKLPPKRKWLVYAPVWVGWLIIGIGLGVMAYDQRDRVQVDYLTPSSVSEVVIYTLGGSAVVCDFSNGSRRVMSEVARQVSASGATEISAMVLTHYHNATSGSLAWLLESEMVRGVWLPRPRTQDEYYMMLSYIEKAKRTQTPVYMYDFGENLAMFGEGVLTLWHGEISRSVQPVLLMTFQTTTQQMTYVGGGVLESMLAEVGQRAIAQSQNVIFGHHGPVVKQAIVCDFAEDAMVCMADKTTVAHLPVEGMPTSGYVLMGRCRFEMDGITP